MLHFALDGILVDEFLTNSNFTTSTFHICGVDCVSLLRLRNVGNSCELFESDAVACLSIHILLWIFSAEILLYSTWLKNANFKWNVSNITKLQGIQDIRLFSWIKWINDDDLLCLSRSWCSSGKFSIYTQSCSPTYFHSIENPTNITLHATKNLSTLSFPALFKLS